ncbi:thioesterase II family protein [Streptomyces dysideae]|uniref:Oleoyl-ACP hydrolase n=1 Tax=Streptomyces dysideae TaxID=909626 RepID=A0A101V5Z3_9ACTN|nr:alpha/beta fold hydrolase [Streptomyces dysideae]KUO23140.1 oleoyl-ACP hydrolase [Streptomyces dysideae]
MRRFQPTPEAPVRLVCLPHAGGSAASYAPLARALAPVADVLAIQYPGRQDRRAEPGITRLTDLADLVADALAPWADRPFVVFGHSMGALLGYEVTVRLEAAGIAPRALVASGRRAPSRHRAESVHLRNEEGVVAELRRLGGVDPAFLDDPELRAMILPAVRGDYEAIETYRHTPRPPLRTPVTVLTGDNDPQVTAEEAAAWAEHTTHAFALRTFKGGHFYLNEHLPEVQAVLRGLLSEGEVSRRPGP